MLGPSLLLPLFLIVFGCATVDQAALPPRVSFIGMTPVEISLMEQTFRVRLRIENPNEFAMAFRGLDYELYVNEERMLSGVSPLPARIEAFDSVVVELPGSGSMLQWAATQDAWDGKLIRYRLVGHAHLENGPSRLEFERLGELRLDKLSGGSI